jgi:hypothetical protein
LIKQTFTTNKNWLLLPIGGMLAFAALYYVSTLLYPGGSQIDTNAAGFSWMNNYWCNLLNEKAINGAVNPAKPVALMAIIILTISLSMFAFQFAELVELAKSKKLLLLFSVTISLLLSLLLATNFSHDLVTNLATFFSLIAIGIIFTGLYNKRWNFLLIYGLLNVFLVGVNNYFYYSPTLIADLPVIQKISFASFLIWIGCISFKLYFQDQKIRVNNPD